MKSITFAIPCYNSAAYMDKCIESILSCGGDKGVDDIEIIIVDDGSVKDDTAEKADRWEQPFMKRYIRSMLFWTRTAYEQGKEAQA